MSCTTWYDNASASIVEQRLSEMQDVGSDTLKLAETAMQALANVDLDIITIRDPYTPPSSSYTPYTKPEVPIDPELEFQGVEQTPVVPVLDDLPVITVGSAGAVPTAPILNYPEQPTIPDLDDLGDPPVLTVIELPEKPDTTLPELPTFEVLQIPAVPSIDWSALLAEFQALWAQRPSLDATATLNSTYRSDLETLYTDLDSKSRTAIAVNPAAGVAAQRVYDLLQGNYSLPVTVAQALRDRAFAGEDILAARAEQQAREDAAARGFALPSAVLLSRLDAIRQQSRDKMSAANRDVFIQEQQVAIENLRFAVQQGIALEQLFRQHFLQLYEASEKVASRLFDIAERVYTAVLKLLELRLEIWKADAAVFEQWVRIQLAQLEQFKVQLDAEKLRGEINVQRVELYKSQLQGILATVEIYKSQIQSLGIITEQDKLRIDVFKAQVEALNTRANLQETRAKIYNSIIQGELGKTSIFESEVRAYSSRVQAVGTQADTEIKTAGLTIDWDKLQLELFQARLNHVKSQLDAEVARIQAGSVIFDGKSRLYSAELGAEQARAQSDQRGFELTLENAKNDATIQIERARLSIAQAQEQARLQVSALDAVARVSGQLAAGAMSAVHAGVSLQDSTSRGNQSYCNEQYTYNMTK